MPADGYADSKPPRDGWCAEAQAAVRELAAEVAALKQTTEEPLTDALAQFLTAQYVLAIKAAVRHASGGMLDLTTLRPLCQDVGALRRGDQAADRLRLDRDRLQLSREAARKRTEEEFKQWLKDAEILEKVRPRVGRSQVIKQVMDMVDHVLLGMPLAGLAGFDDDEKKSAPPISTDGPSTNNPEQTP